MEFSIIRSRRKSICIEVNAKAEVIVRAPFGVSVSRINRFVEEKYVWIEKALAKARERAIDAESLEPLSCEDVRKLADEAMKVIPDRVRFFADRMGVYYGRITIRNQRTRWGSCSSKGNLNFNCLLMLVPDRVRDYVIVHELCHLKEMNHSKRFWTEVEKVMPNYKVYRKWLKDNGNMIIQRMC